MDVPITPRFRGYVQNQNDTKGGPNVVRVQTAPDCKDVCLLSDLPIMAGLYDTQGKSGVYYEILIHRMDGIIAIGEYIYKLSFTSHYYNRDILSSLSSVAPPRLEQT